MFYNIIEGYIFNLAFSNRENKQSFSFLFECVENIFVPVTYEYFSTKLLISRQRRIFLIQPCPAFMLLFWSLVSGTVVGAMLHKFGAKTGLIICALLGSGKNM